MANAKENPYKKWKGGGEVSGHDKIRKLDENDLEAGDYPPDDPIYKDLLTYLPKKNDPRVLTVFRVAPDVADVNDAHIRLTLGGDWLEEAKSSLERLKFVSKNNDYELPFISTDTIDMEILGTKWRAYGKVEFNKLPEEKGGKYFSRVKFKSTVDPNERAVAYWCWP